MTIDFQSFRNPSNNKATGVECDLDTDGTFCDIYMEVCVSEIGSRYVVSPGNKQGYLSVLFIYLFICGCRK